MKYPEQVRINGAKGGPGTFCFLLNQEVAVLCVASNEMGWEHVSVSIKRAKKGKVFAELKRFPKWEEMRKVRHTFWDKHEAVMQLHPVEGDKHNAHPHCLHLWRPIFGQRIPKPPSHLMEEHSHFIKKF